MAGLRTDTLGSNANLAIAFPLAEGSADPAAHTAASRTGFYGAIGTKIGCVVNGVDELSINVGGVSVAGVLTAGNGLTVTAGAVSLPAGSLGVTGLVASNVGDTLYGGVSGAINILPGNSTTTRKFLSQTGTGLASAAPAWAVVAAADVSGLTAWATKAYPADAAGYLHNDGSGALAWASAIGGSIAANQIPYGSGAGTVQGSASLTYLPVATGVTVAMSGAASLTGFTVSSVTASNSTGTVFGINVGNVAGGTARGMIIDGVTSTGANNTAIGLSIGTVTPGAGSQAYGIFQTSAGVFNAFYGSSVFGYTTPPSTSTLLLLCASTAAASSLRIIPGVAPTAPVNGDVWMTSAGLYAQINNVTVGPFGTIGGSIAATRVAFGSGANVVSGSDNLTFDATDGRLFVSNSGLSGASGFTLNVQNLNTTSGTSYGINILARHDSPSTGGSMYGVNSVAQNNVSTAASNTFVGVLGSSNGQSGAANTKFIGVLGDVGTSSGMHNAGTVAAFSARLTWGTQTGANSVAEAALFTTFSAPTFTTVPAQTFTVTNYYGIKLTKPVQSGSGTLAITNRYGVYSDDDLAQNYFAGILGVGIAASPSTFLNLAASTASVSSLRITPGTPPSAPNNGDVWVTAVGLFLRANTVTQWMMANPMTTLGDLAYGGASGASTRLAGDTSNTRKFLTTISTAGVAAAPTWGTIASGDVSGLTAWATHPYPSDVAGLLRNDGSGGFTWDTSTYITGNQTITLSGDASGSGATSIAATVTGIHSKAVPALAAGYLYYDGSAFAWQSVGGTIGGSIAVNQVAVGSGTNTISGSASLTWDGTLLTCGGVVVTAASTTTQAGLRILQGVAPTAPTDGDVWIAAGGAGTFNVRMNSATRTMLTSTGVNPIGAQQITFGSATTGYLSSYSGFTINSVASALLGTQTSGTSTATTATTQWNSSITYAGVFTTGPVYGYSDTVTITGATTTAGITHAGLNISLVANPAGGTVAALDYLGGNIEASGNGLVMGAASVYGLRAKATMNSALTTGAVAAALCGLEIQPSLVMTQASGSNTLAAAYGLYVHPTTWSVATAGTTTTVAAYYGVYIGAITATGSGTLAITNKYGIFQADSSAVNSFAGLVLTAASTTANAGLRIPSGTAPSSPVDGDIWTSTTNLFARHNTTSFQYYPVTGAASNRVVIFSSSTTAMTTSATFTANPFNGVVTFSNVGTLTSGTSVEINNFESICSSAAAATMTGSAMGLVAAPTGGTGTGAIYTGLIGRVSDTSTATNRLGLATMVGMQAVATLSNAATSGAALATLVGLEVTPSIVMTPASGGATITTIYGIWVAPGAFSTATGGTTTTVTNYYGLYIDTVTMTGSGTTTITNRYGVFQSDAAATNSFAGLVITSASTTARSGLRIVPGVAPTAPTDGDIWTTTAGLFVRISGATIAAIGGTIANTQIAFGTAANIIGGSANLTWSGTTLAVTGFISCPRPGTANEGFGAGAMNNASTASYNVAVGLAAMYGITTGTSNTAVGANALTSVQGGSYNVAVGINCLYANTANGNVAIGNSVLFANTTGGGNTAIGGATMNNNTSGSNNTAYGSNALGQNNGNDNTAIGTQAFNSATTMARGVALGKGAGFYETGSDKLFIDNAQRASEADGRLKAMFYGVFASTVAAQFLTLNAGFITSSQRVKNVTPIVTAAGTTVGTATDHVMVFTGTTTQTYTLPAATNGRTIIIKNRSTGSVTVNRAGADTIDGGTTIVLTANQWTVLTANGTDWVVVA